MSPASERVARRMQSRLLRRSGHPAPLRSTTVRPAKRSEGEAAVDDDELEDRGPMNLEGALTTPGRRNRRAKLVPGRMVVARSRPWVGGAWKARHFQRSGARAGVLVESGANAGVSTATA